MWLVVITWVYFAMGIYFFDQLQCMISQLHTSIDYQLSWTMFMVLILLKSTSTLKVYGSLTYQHPKIK